MERPAQWVAYRMQGEVWSAAEVFAPWEQEACAGTGCGLLLDGGVAVFRRETGGDRDTTIAVFQPCGGPQLSSAGLPSPYLRILSWSVARPTSSRRAASLWFWCAVSSAATMSPRS